MRTAWPFCNPAPVRAPRATTSRSTLTRIGVGVGRPEGVVAAYRPAVHRGAREGRHVDARSRGPRRARAVVRRSRAAGTPTLAWSGRASIHACTSATSARSSEPPHADVVERQAAVAVSTCRRTSSGKCSITLVAGLSTTCPETADRRQAQRLVELRKQVELVALCLRLRARDRAASRPSRCRHATRNALAARLVAEEARRRWPQGRACRVPSATTSTEPEPSMLPAFSIGVPFERRVRLGRPAGRARSRRRGSRRFMGFAALPCLRRACSRGPLTVVPMGTQ